MSAAHAGGGVSFSSHGDAGAQATTAGRPHYSEQPRPRSCSVPTDRLKVSPHTRRQQSGTGREVLPQHGRCHLPPTLSGQDDSGRQTPICDSLQYQGGEETSLRQEATLVLSLGKSVGLCSAEAPSTRAEVSGHLSCQSQPSLATNNANKTALSSTAIALWLGTIFFLNMEKRNLESVGN